MKMLHNIIKGCIGPFLFCLAIAILARLAAWQYSQKTSGEIENAWIEHAKSEIEHFRGNRNYALQIESALDRLRRTVTAQLKAGKTISGKTFSEWFYKAVPASHRPPTTLLFAFQKSAGGPPESLKGPGIETSMVRLVGNVLNAALRPDTIPSSQRASLDRQSTGLFGELITLDVLSNLRRGKLTAARWRGGDFLMVWNASETPQKTVFWLALFPRSAMRSAKPIETALRKAAARGRGEMWPVLVPVLSEDGVLRPKAASGTIPTAYLKKLRMAVGRVGGLNSSTPAGVLLKNIDGLWAMRDIVAGNFPYELWIVGPVPRALTNDLTLAWESALYAFLATFLVLFALQCAMNPDKIDVSLRTWFIAFIAVIGIIPLGILWVIASWWISTNAERQIREAERRAEELFVTIDQMSVQEADKFANSCIRAFEDRGLAERLTAAPAGAAGQLAVELEHKKLADSGIKAEYMQVFRAGRDAFISTLGNVTERHNKGLFQIQSGLMTVAFTSLDKKHKDAYINALPARERMIFEGITAAFSNNFGGGYYALKRRGQLLTAFEEPLFITYDFLSSASEFKMALLFASAARPHFAALLQEEVARLPLRMPGAKAAWGRILPGGFEPAPGQSRFISPQMSRVLQEAARANTLQTSRIGERRYIARPCRLMPGFLVGMEFTTAAIRRQGAAKLGTIEAVLAIVASILLIISLAVIRRMLQPLVKLEHGLRRAADGDMSVSVNLHRNDEIGEVTATFDTMIDGLRRRRDLGRFVSATLEENIENASDAEKPQALEGVVLVSDLRNFTTISEREAVEEVVAMLNEHLEAMSEAIKKAGGKIDRFIGDAIVAVFYGEQPDKNASKALLAAKNMLAAHNKIQRARLEKGLFEYRMGVGIDAGTLLIGTIGNSKRMERVILGQPRETAEMLEAASKHAKHIPIMVSTAVFKLLGSPTSYFERSQTMNAWELTLMPEAEE